MVSPLRLAGSRGPAPGPGLQAPPGPPRFPVLGLVIAAVLALLAVGWIARSAPVGDGPVVPAGAIADAPPQLTVVGTDPPGGVVEGVGDPAPDLILELFDGSIFSLAGHLIDDGRPVVMNFWASWCVPCREEMPAIDAVAGRRSDVFFLGVAVLDDEEAARSFTEEIGVSFPLGFDAGGDIALAYPSLGLPTTWFITAHGTIAHRWIGQLSQEQLEELIDAHLTG